MEYLHDGVHVTDNCVAGRGVRATRRFAAGETLEVCPAILVPADQVEALDRTSLYDHYYAWADGAAAIAAGCGSLYNHSYTPNADYVTCHATTTIQIVALHAIETGDEILVDYTRNGTQPLWFETPEEVPHTELGT